MKRKTIWLAFRLAALAAIGMGTAPLLSAQDFTVCMKMDGGAEGTTYYVSPNAIRRTTPGGTDVIDRIDRGTIIYLNHRNKSYKEVLVTQAREAIAKGMGNRDPQKQAMLHKMGLDASPQVSKLGPGEIISGYPTEKYSIKTSMAQGELWITKALQFPAAYYRDFNLLAGVATPFGDMTKISEVHGVVLKRKMTAAMGHGMNATETAVSVEKGAIQDSMFEPPAGYTKAAR